MKKIDELKSRPGWPYLDDVAVNEKRFRTICEELRFSCIGKGQGTFESKALKINERLEKILMRQHSATFHLCKLAVEFNRLPGLHNDKRALAQRIRRWIETRNKLEDEILTAIDEGCNL